LILPSLDGSPLPGRVFPQDASPLCIPPKRSSFPTCVAGRLRTFFLFCVPGGGGRSFRAPLPVRPLFLFPCRGVLPHLHPGHPVVFLSVLPSVIPSFFSYSLAQNAENAFRLLFFPRLGSSPLCLRYPFPILTSSSIRSRFRCDRILATRLFFSLNLHRRTGRGNLS